MSEGCLKELKSAGAIPMREAGFFSVRLAIVGGQVDAAQMVCVGELAKKYGRGQVHLTTRQGIEIPYVALENVKALKEELEAQGLQLGQCGARVRTIVACPGMACSHGLIDTQALARQVAERAKGYTQLPHKFKVCVTGCPNACVKPGENDFGIMGVARKAFHEDLCASCGLCADACLVKGALLMQDSFPVCDEQRCVHCERCTEACPTGAWELLGPAYKVVVGGKMGREPLPARELISAAVSAEAVLELLDRTIAWYCSNGEPKERFGDTLVRCGFENFLEAVQPAEFALTLRG